MHESTANLLLCTILRQLGRDDVVRQHLRVAYGIDPRAAARERLRIASPGTRLQSKSGQDPRKPRP